MFICFWAKKCKSQAKNTEDENGIKKHTWLLLNKICKLLNVALKWNSYLPIIWLIDDGDYDCVDYGGISNKSNGNVYGNIETMHNPYYGGELDEGPTALKINQNPYYGGEIDEGPTALKTSQNPYYGGLIWIHIHAIQWCTSCMYDNP